jgi:hypothetical protein
MDSVPQKSIHLVNIFKNVFNSCKNKGPQIRLWITAEEQ